MKKKLLIIAGIVLGLIAAVLIGLTLFVKSYLQSDKLKALIIPRAEEATGRKVDIDAINVSIFSGISVRGIHVKEKDGAKDFAAVSEFVLKYDLLPLLSKKLVISSIKVVDPSVNVTRDKGGRFNFDDIVEAMKAGKKGEEPKQPKPQAEVGIPFSIIADKIAISNAKLEFVDAGKELPHVKALSDADIKFSVGTEPGALKFSGRLDVKSLDVAMRGLTTRTSGTIDIEPEKVTYALNTAIGSDTVATTGSVQNYMATPDVHLNLYARQLDLDKFMALGGEARPTDKPEKKKETSKSQRGANPVASEKKTDIKAAGEIKVDTARYKGNIVKNILIKYQYSGGAATIAPLSLNFAGGDKADISGILKGNFGFRYLPDKGGAADQIKQTLLGKATVDLDKVQVKQSKITDAAALFTGLEDLRRPSFDKGHFDINIKDQKIFLTGLLTSPRLKVTPNGTIGFNQVLDLLTDVEVSPELSSKLRVAKFTGYLESGEGWTLIPLKITGTSDKPSVGVNQAALKKQLQKGIKGEIQKRLFKEGPQQQQGEKPQDLIKGLFGK